MIARLLIANRGEIACRIARTARRMGIATVAVHSDADPDALHVEAADAAVRVAGTALSDTYLDIAAMVEAARRGGADAVHPGYGFLSENAQFARACAAAGLTFVGPSAEVIEAMADKARAKAIAAEAGVPVVPGYAGEDQSLERLAAEAARIGFPLMVKAAAGGGGRGMRRVEAAAALAAALDGARREAEGAFGDGRLLMERLVPDARHVEVQIFGDGRGTVVHLGERDCSVQRRHQKIVEETPAPGLDAALRARLAADAVRLAAAAGYAGAGTVEFIVAADGCHHFLEVNARLQVEHPVTELATGIDLVEWQIRVARGEPLPMRQDEIAVGGHAIEARLYAEDPHAGFVPQTGRIEHWAMPAGADRVDAGVGAGSEVGPHFDPMLAKLVVRGRDRAEALARLRAALLETEIAGLRTNRSFLLALVESEAFEAGTFTTDLLDRWIAADAPILRAPRPDGTACAVAAAVLAGAAGGDWFRSTGVAELAMELDAGFGPVRADLRFERGRLCGVRIDGEAAPVGEVRMAGSRVRFVAEGLERSAWAVRGAGGSLWLGIGGHTFVFREPDHLNRRAAADASGIVAPLAGLVRAVLVAEGDAVEAGMPVAVIEAMKMETVVRARGPGVVRRIGVVAGGLAATGQTIAEIAPAAHPGEAEPPGGNEASRPA